MAAAALLLLLLETSAVMAAISGHVTEPETDSSDNWRTAIGLNGSRSTQNIPRSTTTLQTGIHGISPLCNISRPVCSSDISQKPLDLTLPYFLCMLPVALARYSSDDVYFRFWGYGIALFSAKFCSTIKTQYSSWWVVQPRQSLPYTISFFAIEFFLLFHAVSVL